MQLSFDRFFIFEKKISSFYTENYIFSSVKTRFQTKKVRYFGSNLLNKKLVSSQKSVISR